VLLRYVMSAACFLVLIQPVSAQTVTDGVIILRQGNKIACKMIKLGKRREEEAAGYAHVQVIDSTGTRTYLPADLLGYIKDGVTYKAFNDNGYTLFARCLAEGRSTLFYHPGGYGEGEEHNSKRYFFKKEGESGFLSINSVTAFPKWIGVPEGPASQMDGRQNGWVPSMPIKHKDTRFIDFFSDYFKECQGVVRKIKTEFYTIDDLQAVFEDFNSCKSVG
jgi:hypothetical protein